MSVGLLIARLVLGLAMAAHGTQKLFGWFGGYGPQGTGGYLESQGFRPGVLFAWALGLGEVGSGLLTALGLLGPAGPALMISIMLVAAVVGHAGKGFFATGGGYELPVIYSAGALALARARCRWTRCSAWSGSGRRPRPGSRSRRASCWRS